MFTYYYYYERVLTVFNLCLTSSISVSNSCVCSVLGAAATADDDDNSLHCFSNCSTWNASVVAVWRRDVTSSVSSCRRHSNTPHIHIITTTTSARPSVLSVRKEAEEPKWAGLPWIWNFPSKWYPPIIRGYPWIYPYPQTLILRTGWLKKTRPLWYIASNFRNTA